MGLRTKRATEAFLVEQQQAAYRAYEEDYLEVVLDSVPLVYAELQAALSEKVRRSSTRSKLLSMTATRDELEQALEVEGIERVCLGFDVAPSLEWSLKNVRADLVHAGTGGVGPYTGSGVKVMIADLGFKEHDRLPTPTAANRMDFTDAPCDITEGCCTAAHGNMVTGVVFCQPGEDDFVGVAYEATPVWAKVFRLNGGNCGSAEPFPWTEFCMPAFDWATSAGPTAPGAKVINFSARGDGYDGHDVNDDTNADSLTALNIDWVVHARGATFVHACGNTGEESDPEGRVQPPSGASNCLSVGGYDDGDDDDRSANVVWEGTSRGTTDDGRKKPDLCAPCWNLVNRAKRTLVKVTSAMTDVTSSLSGEQTTETVKPTVGETCLSGIFAQVRRNAFPSLHRASSAMGRASQARSQGTDVTSPFNQRLPILITAMRTVCLTSLFTIARRAGRSVLPPRLEGAEAAADDIPG